MKKKLNFCMLTTFYPPFNFGGDGISTYQLTNELARRGHQVDVIHCCDAYRLMNGRDPVASYQDHPNVTIHGLRSPWGRLSPIMTQQTGVPVFKTARIKRILEKGFDVIHYHNVSLVGGPKLFTFGRGVKLCTLHDHWMVCPTHVLFKYNRKPCRKRNCLTCQLVYRRPPQLWRYLGLMKRAARHVDQFIAPSNFCGDIHHKMGADIPIAVMPNLVNTIQPLEASNSEGRTVPGNQKPYFLYVGRLEKLKGVQTLIPFFKNFTKARLVIAGGGTYESVLRKQAAGSPHIHFVGYQARHHLMALYRQAVALIVPSLCYETMGRVLVEAFSQATPVIVRNLGPLPEFVEKSQGGVLYRTNRELAAVVPRFLDDRAFARQCGRRAQRAYQKHWLPEAILKRYLEIVKAAVRQRTFKE